MMHTLGTTRRLNSMKWPALMASAATLWLASAAVGQSGPQRVTSERSGVLRTTENQTLHLRIDAGSVQIQTEPFSKLATVRYTVHLETDADAVSAKSLLDGYSVSAIPTASGPEIVGKLPAAKPMVGRRPQILVQYLVTIPASFSLDVTTGVGDIRTGDIGGHAYLQTGGGNITTGNVGMSPLHSPSADRLEAKLETQGGHIHVQDVNGAVDMYTAGGHITAGNISGNARLRTGGGHIRAGNIQGNATLDTDGGNITVGEAGALVMVHTGGGQIDFGEVHGSVRAQTGGGGVRMMHVAGPMEVETRNGSICMTKVSNTVRAETGEGTITAWINPDSLQGKNGVRLPGPSQLASQSGDIVVYLPRNLAATIDASVESGGMQHLEIDPALALNVETRQDGQVHAQCNLNGGGAMLKLKTLNGKIQLHYTDGADVLRQSLLQEQKTRLEQVFRTERFEEKFDQGNSTMTAPPQAPTFIADGEHGDWWDNIEGRLEITFLGGVRESPEEFKKHLISSPRPEYPTVARKAGVQGLVQLQVRLRADGTLVVEKVIEGEPLLVEAATAAIQKWRAAPGQWGGKKVDVISVVSFNFRLQ